MTRLLRGLWEKIYPVMVGSIVGLGLCGLFLWPVISHAPTHLTSPEDGLLIVYLINWVTGSLTEGHSLYQVPFFHPYLNTLAYSVPFLSTAIFTIPLTYVTANLVLIHNLHLIIGCWLVFMAMFLLAQLLYRSPTVAILTATLFTFGTWHFDYVGHLHMWLVAGIPLCVYALLKWQQTTKSVWLYLTALAFLYQALNSPETGLFLALLLVPIIWQPNIRTQLFKHLTLVLTVGFLTVATCVIFYWPYVQVSRQFQYTRSIRDSAHFAHSLNVFWAPEFGLTLVLLGGWWYLHHRWPQPPDQLHSQLSTHSSAISSHQPYLSSNTLWLITLLGAILMLGPALKFNGATVKILSYPIPLPYAVGYYLLPVFQAFRTTSRWIVVAGFGVSLLIGQAADRSRWRPTALVGVEILVVIVLWLTQSHVIHLFPFTTPTPAVYKLLAAQPETVIAELPVYLWQMQPYGGIEDQRLLYQISHGKTLFNGVSGFIPPQRETDINWLWLHFPESKSLAYLKSQGVELIVVHFQEYAGLVQNHFTYLNQPAPHPDTLKDILSRSPDVTVVGCESNSCIYKIK